MTQTLSSALLTFLLNSLWQVPLIAGAGWLASTLLRRSPASYRHGVWMLTAVAALILPLSSIRVSYRTTSERVTPIVPAIVPPRHVIVGVIAGPAKAGRHVRSPPPLLTRPTCPARPTGPTCPARLTCPTRPACPARPTCPGYCGRPCAVWIAV